MWNRRNLLPVPQVATQFFGAAVHAHRCIVRYAGRRNVVGPTRNSVHSDVPHFVICQLGYILSSQTSVMQRSFTTTDRGIRLCRKVSI